MISNQEQIASLTYLILMSILTIAVIVWVVLSIVFRNHQPLKSRPRVLHYTILILYLYMVWEITLISIVPPVVACYIVLFVSTFSWTGVVVMFMFRTARFLLVINLNKYKTVLFDETVKLHELREKEQAERERKKQNQKGFFSVRSSRNSVRLDEPESKLVPSASQSSISDSDTTANQSDGQNSGTYWGKLSPKEKKAIAIIKVLRAMASEWFTVLGFVVIALVYYTTTGLIVVFTDGYCIYPERNSKVFDMINPAFQYIMIVIFVLLLLYDVVANLKLIVRCKWRQIIFEDDPFLFRIELIIAVGTLVLLMVNDILLRLIPAFSDFLRVRYPVLGVLNLWLMYVILSVSTNGFVIVATVWRWIRGKIRLKRGMTEQLAGSKLDLSNPEGLVEYIINNRVMFTQFKSFAKSEWSLENVLLYETIMRWNGTSRKRDRIQFARRIADTYIKQGSMSQANLSGAVTRKVMEQIQNIQDGEPIPKDLFQPVLSEIKINLMDTAGRFVFTKDFTRASQKAILQEETLA